MWKRHPITLLFLAGAALLAVPPSLWANDDNDETHELLALLRQVGFTGRIQSTLEQRLGRPLEANLATLGRDLFFDSVTGLHGDNSCSGCHSPTNGFGDSQSIAIGVDNNGIVGPRRSGPRNQRRTPAIANTAFYPKLMWNGRFFAPSGDPFDNSAGFTFPLPEGTGTFLAGDPEIRHLLVAQAHIPPTELTEAAGFTGTRGTLGPAFDPFDDGHGEAVPAPDASGFRNEPIRQAVLSRINAIPAYRARFGARFPDVAAGQPITFRHIAQAIAEFELTMTFADAPLDRFARGDHRALTGAEKRGAILFFGRAGCVSCHAVRGPANEMFSDFDNHVLGVPQIAPVFGPGTGNVLFDGPGADEDFGLEQITGDAADRYKFRTSPLRNLALQPAFFHNGAFTSLKDAVLHHLDAVRSATEYDPKAARIDRDLRHRLGPIAPVLERLDPLVSRPPDLSREEVEHLVAFLSKGLLDPDARPERLCRLVPASVPSGRPVLSFEHCGPFRSEARHAQ
jgi:cytochrome c peroxidase